MRWLSALTAIVCVIDVNQWGDSLRLCHDLLPEPPSIVREVSHGQEERQGEGSEAGAPTAPETQGEGP